MALSKKSVEKAINILLSVNPGAQAQKVSRSDIEFPVDTVLLQDEKADGGFESVYMYLKFESCSHMDMFDQARRGIPNTSICERMHTGFYKIGWY